MQISSYSPPVLSDPLQRTDNRSHPSRAAKDPCLITLTKLHNPLLHCLFIPALPPLISPSCTHICVHLRPQLLRKLKRDEPRC